MTVIPEGWKSGSTRVSPESDTPALTASAATISHLLVSVIVPIYQVGPYLIQCVDSILSQTHAELEIILVDDGSIDEGAAICNEYEAQDSRVHVIHQANAGLSAARNAGLDMARGKYIAFVDGDDAIAPTFVEVLLDACEMGKRQVSQCGYATDFNALGCDLPGASIVSQGTLHFEGLDTHEALRRLATDSSGAYAVVWNKLYRRDVFEGVRFPEGRQHEDEFVTYRLLWNAGGIAVTDAPFYFYRQRSTSVMGMGFSEKTLDAIDALGERESFYRQQGADDLALFTRATRCHRLREMSSHFDELPSNRAAWLRDVMYADYRAVMVSHGPCGLTIRKKIALTMQMISPALHYFLANVGRE